MNPEELISAWEDAYREYGEDPGSDLCGTSRAVAKAWCALAESVDLPWWLYAAVRSAAEAFEVQGAPGSIGVTAMLAGRGGARFGGGKPTEDGDDQDQEEDRTARFCPTAAPLVPQLTSRWPKSDDDLVNATHRG